MDCYNKYLKYKKKYLNLQKQLGGTHEKILTCWEVDRILPVDTPIVLIYGQNEKKDVLIIKY